MILTPPRFIDFFLLSGLRHMSNSKIDSRPGGISQEFHVPHDSWQNVSLCSRPPNGTHVIYFFPKLVYGFVLTEWCSYRPVFSKQNWIKPEYELLANSYLTISKTQSIWTGSAVTAIKCEILTQQIFPTSFLYQ